MENEPPEKNAPLEKIYNSVNGIRKKRKSSTTSPKQCGPCTCNLDQNHQSQFPSIWPGLTAELDTKHLKPYIATTKVNQRDARKNVRYTRQGPPRSEIHDMTTDHIPVLENYFYTKVVHLNEKVFR